MHMQHCSINSRYQTAESLLGMLLSTAIGMLLCIAAFHYLMTLCSAYYKLQQRFQDKHAWLVARHFIGTDLYQHAIGATTCAITPDICEEFKVAVMPASDVLVLQTATGRILYYARKSVIPDPTLKKYALYRDDLEHKSQAIVEDIKNFTVNIRTINEVNYNVIILTQISNKILELTCTF